MNPRTVASPTQPAVWFPDWGQVLSRADLPLTPRQQYRRALGEYLRFCKRTRQRATVDSARRFMQEQEAQGNRDDAELAIWKLGLNWFFREAGQRRVRSEAECSPQQVNQPAADDFPAEAGKTIEAPRGRGAGGPVMSGVPSLAARDLGKTEWERRLIRELRGRHYRWRTEQTYRGWAWRFDRWLQEQGRRWDTAGEAEIKEFLSDLATRQRASASAQKQALNALVFLLREALGRALAEFGDFTRARKVTRVPVVLTREECQRLFAALEGVPQLMAELMYGSGLRLTELLGLRVKDVDLERRQLIIRAGKGDKDRVTVLPEMLVERLRAQRERLRLLSPLNVLQRGYSITTDAGTGQVLRDASQTQPGQQIRTQLHKGEIKSRVED